MFFSYLIIILSVSCSIYCDNEVCDSEILDGCTESDSKLLFFKERKYLLYDVNPGEGFNLRRDVYMRIANMIVNVIKETLEEWVLVLPPWGPLYHWQNKDLGEQIKIPWRTFFDISSMNSHVPVMEFEDFIKEHGPVIDEIYYLQNYAEGWTDGKWEERMDVRECNDPPPYEMIQKDYYEGWFWGYREVYSKAFHCLSIQGYSSTLKPLLKNLKVRSILVDRAEIILHDMFGGLDYWLARRSMRFAKHLRELGDSFRLKYLNSSDESDNTRQDEDWRNRKPDRTAVGGNYLAAHLRRKDFLYARQKEVPQIKHAAYQLRNKMKELGLNVVYIATDAPDHEFQELKLFLPEAVKYNPSREVQLNFKEGGIAIIDQWICAHARYFTGTFESTFSFRIQEEREILGFKPSTTFNRLCGENKTSCKQPSQWTIVYE